MELQENAFVRWTSSVAADLELDDDAEFVEKVSYVGQIVRFNDERVQIQIQQPQSCVISVPRDDGKFEPAEKPEDWGFVAPPPKAPASAPARRPKPRTRKKKEGKTKPELVADLFRDDMPKSRADAIKRVVEAGICGTDAAASTAWNSAKKLLT